MQLTIETDNAAFGEDIEEGDDHQLNAEVARLLRDAASKIEQGRESGSLFDYNGNKVGQFSL